MKILLDHNLDRRLKRHLTGYETETTQEQGWADLLNGELLIAAENAGFGILITADSNLKNQQNLEGRRIAVPVLRAPNNRLSTHVEMTGQIVEALGELESGRVKEIFHTSSIKKD